MSVIPVTTIELQKDRERRRKNKELICHTHDKLRDAAERISFYDLANTRVSDIQQMQEDIIELSEYIVELVDYAKERGQAMEDRLSAYANAIHNLGYKRTK